MAGDWQMTSLGELIDVKHGYAFKGKLIHDEPRGDVLLTPGNFAIGGGFKGNKFKYYDGPVPEEFVLREGDLVVTMTDLSKQADTLGYPAFVPARADGRRYLHNQRLGKVLVKTLHTGDPRYLHYLMCSPEYRHEVLASATGTTVKHTSPERIKRFRFRRPPLPEQRAIAEVLGALDDKIDLNRRMNETLEAIARALFKSWFVDFDPVRANAEGRQPYGMDAETAALFPDAFEDSPLGKIPKGWKAASLGDVVDVSPSRSVPKGQRAPYVEMSNMPNSSARVLDWMQREFTSGSKFMSGDVLVARITPCLENGKTAYVDFLEEGDTGWGSTEFIVLRSKGGLPPEYAYFLARTDDFRSFAVGNMTGTSGRQRVPTDVLTFYQTILPPLSITERFGAIAEPTMRAMQQHDDESRTLTELRDALLPKLLSGEVRVKDAQRVVETA